MAGDSIMKFRIRDWVPTYLLVLFVAVTIAFPGGTEIAVFVLFIILQLLWLGVPLLANAVGRRVGGEGE